MATQGPGAHIWLELNLGMVQQARQTYWPKSHVQSLLVFPA